MKLPTNFKLKLLIPMALIALFPIIRALVLFSMVGRFDFPNLFTGVFITIFILFLPLVAFKIKVKRYLFIIFTFLTLSNLVAVVHLFQYKTPISMGGFAAIADTTGQEAVEFLTVLNPAKWAWAFVLSFLPFLGLGFLKKAAKIPQINALKIVIGSIFLAFLSSGITSYVKYQNLKITRDFTLNPSFVYQDIKRVNYYYKEKRKLSKLIKGRKNLRYEVEQDTLNQDRIFVLIIGESMAKGHLGLYGYGRNTTPKLGEIDSLLIYTDVISPATRTAQSILRILSQAQGRETKPFLKKGSILTLAKNAGYTTYWVSNQQMLGIYNLCNVYVLPSQGRGETWGLAVNEAMACGKAILASNRVGCAVDLVKNNENGFIFESNNIEDLKDKIKRFENNYSKFGEKSKKLIKNGVS